MIVYKYYLKIAKTYSWHIIAYTLLFLGLNIFVGMYNSNSNDYTSTKVNVAIINHDHNSILIDGLQDYLNTYANIITLKEDQESLKDALFFRQVDYILIIPENYSNSLINGQESKIETMTLPDSYNSIYSQNLINNYLNTAKLYLKAGISQDLLVSLIEEDLAVNVNVSLLQDINNEDFSQVNNYYNFANYMLITITMVVITMIMVSFNDQVIKRRNMIAPLAIQNINRQLLLGNGTLGLIIWFSYVLFSIILYPEAMLTYNGLLIILNSLALMIFIQVFSFMMTKITSNREILSGVGNVFGLGCSFICGAFVPQSLLSPFVLTIAKLFPSYWYIKNNNDISKLTKLDFSTLQPILINIIIILSFALLTYLIMQLISKIKIKE